VANLNRIILVGNLANNPDAKFTTEGTAITKFTLDVKRPKRADGVENSDPFDVIVWGSAAEVSGEQLKKNSLTLVEGRIQIRTYDDQEGNKKWVTEIVANTVTLLGSVAEASISSSDPFENAAEIADEDIPF
jgi:single-strand DNA-binding protein